VPELGAETPLEAISEERVDSYRQRLLTEGKVSRRTVQKQMVLLHGIFKRAYALKWTPINPADGVERVSVRYSGEFNVLSVEQVEAVARHAEGMFSGAIIVAAYTGLRTGELRALRWRDVDFPGASLRVQRNMPAGGEEDAPKSGKVRSVPLTDDVARELDRLSRRKAFTGLDDRVFSGPGGAMLAEDAFRDALYEAMKRAGIDREAFPARSGFTFHDLRHTFGTRAAQAFPLHDVQAFMGHADIQTTMRYLHHVPKHNAAQQFTESLRRERAGEGGVSPTVSRTAENSENPTELIGTDSQSGELNSTPRP
jgi:integrase